MKTLIPYLFVLGSLFVQQSLQAQKHEVGLVFGAANFLGDLGGANHIGVPFLQDVEPTLFRPAGGFFYKYNLKKVVSFEVNVLATQVRGDDKLVSDGPVYSAYWYRHYRNLNFKSLIASVSFNMQIDLLRYKNTYKNHTYWTPFVGIGVGLFYMDPKASINGDWIRLQPLGTEGQGLPGHRQPYSLIQPNFPLTIGVKYQYNKHWKFELSCIHHLTLTDYIDDVSTNYVDPAELYAHYDNSKAALIYALSKRSSELDPDNLYGTITSPGEQRGNPKNKDSYFMVIFKVSYVFGTSHYDYNCFKK
jgi:hypothetical protein